MKVKCTNCNAVFGLPDDKVPKGKTVRIVCPRCGGKFTVAGKDRRQAGAAASGAASGSKAGGAISADVSGWTVRFDRLEKDGERALLCLADDGAKAELEAAVAAMGFGLREVADPATAIEWWKQNQYRLVLIDEGEDVSALLRHPLIVFSRALPMRMRRNGVVCLLSRSLQTMDGLAAFRFGVDLILNRQDVARAAEVLNKAVADHRAAYLEFNRIGKEIGVL